MTGDLVFKANNLLSACRRCHCQCQTGVKSGLVLVESLDEMINLLPQIDWQDVMVYLSQKDAKTLLSYVKVPGPGCYVSL